MAANPDYRPLFREDRGVAATDLLRYAEETTGKAKADLTLADMKTALVKYREEAEKHFAAVSLAQRALSEEHPSE